MDLDAEHYREHSKMQYGFAYDPLTKFSFKGDEDVLDIGCGDGKITAFLAERVPNGHVTGVDLSPAMIDLAKKTYNKRHLEFLVGDAQNLVGKNQFDLITSFSCLHWVFDQEAVFKRISELLKPNGKVLVVTYQSTSSFGKFLDAMQNHSQWKSYARPLPLITEAGYRSITKKNGFRSCLIEVTPQLAIYETIEDFKNYLKGWLGCLMDLPISLQEPFLEEAIEYAKKYSISKKKIHLPFELLTMSLVK